MNMTILTQQGPLSQSSADAFLYLAYLSFTESEAKSLPPPPHLPYLLGHGDLVSIT